MGAELLNQLGIPVIMCVGNHDMYYRDKRDVYTTEIFAPFENITLVYDSPKIFPMLGDKGALVSPYLMPEEYPELLQYTNMPIWWGHFEFSGFVITGDTRVLEHGPDHKPYKAVKHIFSGHFHKRQCKDNVCYIGNAFPADFSDANDAERGAFLYSYDDDASSFYNWGADFGMPTYVKANLSEIIEDPDTHLKKNARVRCLADIDLTLEDSNELRDTLMKKYGLRELTFEEMSTDEALTDTDMDLEGMELETTTNIVVELLGRIKEPKIDNQKLIKVYKDLGDV
jgi:DNA repair exonuclease SbcCD nuclease subunit